MRSSLNIKSYPLKVILLMNKKKMVFKTKSSMLFQMKKNQKIHL